MLVNDLSFLKPGSKIHLMGICGTAMASLAGMLKDMGYQITGSDQNVYPPMSTQLEELGIEIMEGYQPENLKHKPDLVIVGNVISRHFPEAEELVRLDLPYTSLPKALGEFAIGQRNSIVMTGTHGKTTTTSIMAWVAENSDLKPGYLIGGIPENFSRSFRAPQEDTNKEWFIIEGDEYDTAYFDKVPKFVHYRPKYVVLTSLEFDHADIYGSLDDIKASFRKLMELIPEDGLLICNSDDKNVMEVAELCKAKKVSYGLNSGDYKAVNREISVGRNQFSVEHQGEKIADIATKMFGPHNTLNCLAAFALANELGWKSYKTLQALASFKGVKRRQEIIGEPNGITIVEDFAHHPTAVNLTIQTIKERYHGRKVFSIFEPRSATSRRKVFQKDYLEAFKNSDVTILPKAFNQDKISEEDRFSSEELIDDLKAAGKEAHYKESADDIVQLLKDSAQTDDVILIMSNGGFDGIYEKLLKTL